MQRKEYVATRARELAECMTEEAANRLVEQVEADIQRSDLTEEDQKRLWRKLRKHYEQEPKPFLKETISARKLNQLQAAVQQFLQAKSGN